jgi:hypothetical protein
VGSVAEEAARLLDALGGWASSTQAGYAARSAPSAASRAEDGSEEDGAGQADGSPSPAGGTASRAGTHETRCESCGAENGMGQAITCQLCPVCQGIGLLRSVRPETVDRLADLAGALAATLRDIAGQRRADADPSPRKPSSQSTRTRVQDITVDDEDEHPGSATS